MNHLSFGIQIEDVAAEPDDDIGAHRAIQVVPEVDGIIVSFAVFDALSVIAHHLTSASFDLFTCSCGVAGCAGIFKEVALCVTDETVSWTFPEEPFRGRLDAALFPADRPLRLVFDKAQYAQALSDLWERLLAVEAEGPTPVAVQPDCYPDLSEPLGTQLKQCQAGVAAWRARMAERAALYREFIDAEVRIQLRSGAEYRVFLESLVDAYALWTTGASAPKDATQALLRDEILPKLRKSTDAIGEIALALPRDILRIYAWRTDEQRASLLEEDLTGATVSVELLPDTAE